MVYALRSQAETKGNRTEPIRLHISEGDENWRNWKYLGVFYEPKSDYPDDAGVWALRHRWGEEKQRLQAELRSGRYRTQPLRRVQGHGGERLSLWAARDALVLKALTWVLEGVLPVAASCTHVRGHGGAKAAVRAALEHLPENGFVFRTDVASYYDSISHRLLLERLERYVADPGILDLVRQYLRRT
ncbi:MAG: hypothetical protein GY953_05670, partial [bacterium]|nr:hypothetical protein [bacterium]